MTEQPSPEQAERHYFADDRHNLYVGWVLGTAMKYGLPFQPVIDDDGNYTDRLIIPFGEHTITVIVPEPPDDWRIDER